MGAAFPASHFVGFDLSSEAIPMARHEASQMGLGNVEFLVTDNAELDGEQRYDFITAFDAMHDQARPADVLEGIARASHDLLTPNNIPSVVDLP